MSMNEEGMMAGWLSGRDKSICSSVLMFKTSCLLDIDTIGGGMNVDYQDGGGEGKGDMLEYVIVAVECVVGGGKSGMLVTSLCVLCAFLALSFIYDY